MKVGEPLRRAKRVLGCWYRAIQTPLARVVFDRNGVNTDGRVYLEEVGVAGEGRNPYEPSGYMFLSRALRGFEITEDDVLVDYGCGKGRIVAQAARHYPFKKVIGLEISERLGAVASEEVEMNRDRFRAREVELVVDDAATWPLPDETTFIYLFHSFGEPVFSSVLDRINESLERRPRRLVLIYVRPLLHSRLLANGRFRLVKVSRGLRPDLESHRIHVYVVG